jgi:protein-L-isoaspartate(D-aspartate) O-methyltransferase
MLDQQLAARGVVDPNVLQAMRVVPRERFVPAGEAAFAYEDRALPIECGQTISQPY